MNHLRKTRDLIDVVIYHNPCMDGFASMYVVYRYFKDRGFRHHVHYIPKYIDHIPLDESLYAGKHVLMTDIVTDDYKIIKEKAASLVILDHHKTNRDLLNNIDYAYFDMNKSGVGITWEYFHEHGSLPFFLATIQDRDLWKFKYDRSKEFNEGLYQSLFLEKTFEKKREIFDSLYNETQNYETTIFDKYYNLGVLLNKIKQAKIANIASTTQIYNVVVDKINYKAAINNCSHDLASDLGNYLVENTDCDFAVLWRYDHEHELYYYSLRSIDSKTDVSMITKFFGGGGHRNASGCESKNHPKILFNYSK